MSENSSGGNASYLTSTSTAQLAFAVDAAARTITGIAVPYGGEVAVAGKIGQRWTFAKGTLTWTDPSRVKLFVNHDPERAVGFAIKLDDTDAGLIATFKVANTPEGDHALTMAADGVWDGLSIGVRPGVPLKYHQDSAGVFHAVSVPLMEVSLTPVPAFDDARVLAVAASATAHINPEGNTMTEENPAEAPAMAAGDTITGAISGTVTITPDAPAEDTDLAEAVTAAVNTAMAAQFSALGITPGTGRTVVPAAGPGAHSPVVVREADPYRFDGVRGAHEFSTDLAAALGLGALNAGPNPEAYTRVLKFMAEKLDPTSMTEAPAFVATGDTSAVNPTQYRPDMFVDEQRFGTPLYNAFYKGALSDVTPFTFAKFGAAANLVADHVQGVEPAGGTYSVAAGSTITPAPVSGKIHINREVGDQGGNPQISALIWSKIEYEYRKALELKVAALLAAADPAEFPVALAPGANTVATLATPMEQAIMRLNFKAGGQRYNYAPTHLDLYLALGGLKDGQDRPYFPIIGATNANGTTSNGYPSLNVAGTKFDPVWSLGTETDGAAHKSYIADTSTVWFWASAPLKLDKLQEKVEGWDVGVWGYQAGAITDLTGLLKVTYDPAV